MRLFLTATCAAALTACGSPEAEAPASVAAASPEADAAAASLPVALDPAGEYVRRAPSEAALRLERANSDWRVTIDAAGVPNGPATAATCGIVASGPLTDGRIRARVQSAGGMEQRPVDRQEETLTLTIEAAGVRVDDGGSPEGPGVAGRLCPQGSEVSGLYTRRD